MPRDGNPWSASLASQFPQDYKQHRALCRSELASRWQPLDHIAGKPVPTGTTNNTAHSAGASLPRDGNRWSASLASQLPQDLQATPRTLWKRACLAMATAGSHRWQASSHRVYKQHRALCRSELASRWQPLDHIAGKPAPTGSTSNTAHSAGASLPRDGNHWIGWLASQLPQGLQATPRTLQERACLAMATAGSHRWQASSHRAYKQQRTLCRSELASRWQPLDRIAGKPVPTGPTSNTAHSVEASLPRDGNRWITSLASQLPQELQTTPHTL